MIRVFPAAFLCVTLFLCGCGGGGSEVIGIFNNAEYLIVDEGAMELTDTRIRGTGSIVFNSPLPAVGSKVNYQLSFRLENGGALTLLSNSTNDLGGGVEIAFLRQGQDLNVTLSAGGEENDVSGAFASIDASDAVELFVDVHNDEEPAHVLAWAGDETSFDEDDALFNSEEDGMDTPGNGSGSFWGLGLLDADVAVAASGAAKFVH